MVISKICCNFKVLIYKQLQTKIAMITEDKVTEIFCMADDFCKFFDAMVAKYTLKPTGKRKYHRDSTMSKAEVMLIMILFHDSGYHCFKHFYLEKRCCVSMYKGLLTHSLLCFKFVELTLNNINCDINVFSLYRHYFSFIVCTFLFRNNVAFMLSCEA